MDYVLKGNFDMELTRGHMKLVKGGRRSKLQLGKPHLVIMVLETLMTRGAFGAAILAE